MTQDDQANVQTDLPESMRREGGSEHRTREMVVLASAFSAAETAQRLKQDLQERDIPLFATFDHAENAREAGLALRPTVVLVFGSPQVGTLLMQEDQRVAYALPLRIAVWEDAEGRTWLGYVCVQDLMRNYGLEDHPAIKKMDALLESLAQAATRPL